MIRFMMSCLAALGALVILASASVNPLGALILAGLVFFITNGLGD